MNFDNMMKELQSDYIKSIPEKVQLLENYLNKGDQSALRDRFHRMKGSGATYGLPEVSELSAVMERICERKGLPLNEVIPPALEILTDIYTQREKASYDDKRPYILETDQRFLNLKDL